MSIQDAEIIKISCDYCGNEGAVKALFPDGYRLDIKLISVSSGFKLIKKTYNDMYSVPAKCIDCGKMVQ